MGLTMSADITDARLNTHALPFRSRSGSASGRAYMAPGLFKEHIERFPGRCEGLIDGDRTFVEKAVVGWSGVRWSEPGVVALGLAELTAKAQSA